MSVDETLMCSFKKIKPGEVKKKITNGLSGKKSPGFGKKYTNKFGR